VICVDLPETVDDLPTKASKKLWYIVWST